MPRVTPTRTPTFRFKSMPNVIQHRHVPRCDKSIRAAKRNVHHGFGAHSVRSRLLTSQNPTAMPGTSHIVFNSRSSIRAANGNVHHGSGAHSVLSRLSNVIQPAHLAMYSIAGLSIRAANHRNVHRDFDAHYVRSRVNVRRHPTQPPPRILVVTGSSIRAPNHHNIHCDFGAHSVRSRLDVQRHESSAVTSRIVA
jgi:hypothetical protein